MPSFSALYFLVLLLPFHSLFFFLLTSAFSFVLILLSPYVFFRFISPDTSFSLLPSLRFSLYFFLHPILLFLFFFLPTFYFPSFLLTSFSSFFLILFSALHTPSRTLSLSQLVLASKPCANPSHPLIMSEQRDSEHTKPSGLQRGGQHAQFPWLFIASPRRGIKSVNV